MKQQIYKGIDDLDDEISLVWVNGDKMMVVYYEDGDEDFVTNTNFENYSTSDLNLERFYNLTLLREF